MTTKLISWNVNGIRAALRNGFEDFFTTHNPDVLCLQEVKAEQQQVEYDPPGYQQYWNSADKKGYSGTAIFSKIEPLNVSYGLGIDELDKEGRVITLEFDQYFLVTVYTPNSQNQLKRLDYRIDQWDVAFRNYVANLDKTKPVVFCGDLNVAHKEIDLKNPAANVKNAGFTPQERLSFDKLLAAGFVDSFRCFNSEPEQYSWWSYRTKARERNVGWRIDYFLVSSRITEQMKTATILQEVHGSDHCPVTLELSI